MDAQEYVDLLRDEKAVISLAHFNAAGECDGRGRGLIIDEDQCTAIMIEPCGSAIRSEINIGAIVAFVRHPEAEPKIVGRPAYF